MRQTDRPCQVQRLTRNTPVLVTTAVSSPQDPACMQLKWQALLYLRTTALEQPV